MVIRLDISVVTFTSIPIKHRLTKKGKDYWEVYDPKTGKILRGFRSEIEAKTFAASCQKRILQTNKKQLEKILTWPDNAPNINDNDIWSDIENRKPWQSVIFAIAKTDGLLQTSEVAAYLGVSEAWVRQNIRYSEWHHSYKQKGDGGKAFFYNPDHVLDQILDNKILYDRLTKLSTARIKKIKKLLDTENHDTEPLVPGWKHKVDMMRFVDSDSVENKVRTTTDESVLIAMTSES